MYKYRGNIVAIARADFHALGRCRGSDEFDEGDRCALCDAGPYTCERHAEEHEGGRRHAQNFSEYIKMYKQVEQERATLWRAKKVQEKIAVLKMRDSYSHDLAHLKAAAFDFIMTGIYWDDLRKLDIAITIHEKKVKFDLLVLAFVRSRLTAQFGSVDEARIQCALQEQAATCQSGNVHTWVDVLSDAGNFSGLVRTLVMPFL